MNPKRIPPERRVLLVFAKAPVPGRVKTRIAETLGDEESARIYRVLGRRVVDRIRHGRYRTVVFHDPPDSREIFEAWLGSEGLDFLGQPEGELGVKLAEGFRWAFRHGDLVAAVGTDIPDLDASRVESAFESLAAQESASATFGPAMDGGYYLVALNRESPGIFDGIPWSTSTVLEASLARANALGIRTSLLAPLADVDRAEDLPTELRSMTIRSDP